MNSDNSKSAEQEIDLLELCKDLWTNKFFIFKFSIVGLVLGIIIAYSMPKAYTTNVSLASDQSSGSSSGNMGAIAAMAGLNLVGSNSTIFTSPELFPEILNSTPFLNGLFDMRVKDEKISVDTTLYVYLHDYQKSPWWSSITSVPSKLLGLFFNKKEDLNQSMNDADKRLNYKVLSSSDETIINQLKKSINISSDKKTGIINLSVTMQSPGISASVASTITSYLQKYIINYRTLKARENLDFTQKLYEETKSNYYSKQQELATYMDSNLGVVSAKTGTTRDRLQNEVDLAYTIYNQMAQELQKTKIKVQDNTPVYTIIQPAVEPLVPVSPNKKMIILSFLILFSAIGSGWVLFKNIYKK